MMNQRSSRKRGGTPRVAGCFLLALGMAWPAAAQWNVHTTDVDGDGVADLVVEGERLAATIRGREGGLMRLEDRVRGRQEVKTLEGVDSTWAINELRIAPDTDYAISHEESADGTLRVEARATTAIDVGDQTIAPVVIIKHYDFEPDATRVRITTRIDNQSGEVLNLAPWVRHLLQGSAEPSSFMTPFGVWESGSPIPHLAPHLASHNTHYFSASNWISRTAGDRGNGGNTLATVTRPSQMFKVYTWRKSSEGFMTQEVIFAPGEVEPGEVFEFAYYLTLTEPLATPAYASPLLNIQVSPHPTGLDAATRELVFEVAATKPIGAFTARGELVRLDAEAPPQVLTLAFDAVGPRGVARDTAPVALAEDGRYLLTLHLTREGEAFLPGAEIDDTDPVVIPLVVGESVPQQPVYVDRSAREGLFPRIEPRRVEAQGVASWGGLEVFRYPTTERAFETDQPVAATSGPVELAAAANEYESLHLVMTNTGEGSREFAVDAGALVNERGDAVEVDRVSRLLYAQTRVPSQYKLRYPIGRYPDALRATEMLEVPPGRATPLFITYRVKPGTPAGLYRGVVKLSGGGASHELPVTMRVWDVELPTRPMVDVSASMKAGSRAGEAMREMYLRYKATPNPVPVTATLLRGDFDAAQRQMSELVERGASRIYLGNSETLLKTPGVERLARIEAFLAEHGWIEYFYVRPGMDEASPDLADELAARCARWGAVSSIDIMENYYYHAPQLAGKMDIYSLPFTDEPWVKRRQEAGDHFWRVNCFPASLEVPLTDPWVKYLQMDHYGFTGTYIWSLSAWLEYDWGRDWWSDGGAGNLEATLIWHDGDDLLPTLRLEAFRDAIEGHALVTLLRRRLAEAGATDDPALLARAEALLTGTPLWRRIGSAHDVERLRREVGDVLSGLNAPAEGRQGAAHTDASPTPQPLTGP